MIYLGIDPGATGALASLTDAKQLNIWSFENQTEREILDDFNEAINGREFTPIGNYFGMLEAVHSFPRQGVASSFKFGGSFGFLRGLLVALEIPFELVAPQKWQKALGCLSHGDKKIPHAKAQQLFPQIKIRRSEADAVLLAEHCRRVHGGNGGA